MEKTTMLPSLPDLVLAPQVDRIIQ